VTAAVFIAIESEQASAVGTIQQRENPIKNLGFMASMEQMASGSFKSKNQTHNHELSQDDSVHPIKRRRALDPRL
jgi:hypothetical protein